MIITMNHSSIYILTFTITALYDVILRKLSENYNKIPSILQNDFVYYLKPYFKKHTLLAAALIAGFVGATTQVIILNVHKLPTNVNSLISFMVITFIVSALYGFVMKMSNLFPHLVNTYYKKLGVFRSMYTDGISGLIVQSTLLLILYLMHLYNTNSNSIINVGIVNTAKIHPASIKL